MEDWKKNHPLTPKKPERSIYFPLQVVLIMILVFSFYHYPPTVGLPHADVLVLDMTHQKDASRDVFLSLLDQAHLSHVLYDSVTVNLFRLIPTGDYSVIVIWAHSGINDIATTEPYQMFGHVLEQLTGEVGDYLYQGKQYYSIEPGLVRSIKGQFHGSLVLLMGCNTMTQPDLAQAFIQKGSSIVVGWKGLISLSATDTFAISLFQRILQDHMPMSSAIAATQADLGSLGLQDLLTSMSAS